MNQYIWNDGNNYFIENQYFDPDEEYKMGKPGVQLTVYIDDDEAGSERKTLSFWFLSNKYHWIQFKK